jgi:tRNA (mo5U34)-methyltransferase
MNPMETSQVQARIDAIKWYHDFDFGNGLKARSTARDSEVHRGIWMFIERNLDSIDFGDKTVLDVGCWDGYWSFYAERRGAKEVLAIDDSTQNWAEGKGIFLAKELLGSKVEIDLSVSAYQLAALNRKFDIILFLGVYYHLFDPFYALAQLRHCCHDETILLMQGAEAVNLSPGTALYDFSNHGCEWLPTQGVMKQLLKAAYFEVDALNSQPPGEGPIGVPGVRWRMRLIWEALKASHKGVREKVRQFEPGYRTMFINCVPFFGENSIHYYRPPFGLDKYDLRFRDESNEIDREQAPRVSVG